MKKTAIVWLFVLGLVMLARSNFLSAQITLTAKDAPSTTDIYFVMANAETVAVDLGQPGANRFWDFSNIVFTGEDYWRVVDFNRSPFAHRFPTGNLTYKVIEYEKDTTFITYNYARLTETELTQLGRGVYQVVGTDTSLKEIVVAKRTKPQLHLPVTYGIPDWDSVVEVDTIYSGFKATVIDSNYNRVDGWGTIKAALGEFPCLRIRQDHSTMAYVELIPGFKIKYPVEINVNYYWVTNDYGIIATVTGMSDPQNKPVPDPIYSTAKSVNIMTQFLTSVKNVASGSVVKEFELLQNYPNPFNPQTTIRYRISEPGEVKLKVFNFAGQEIATLVNTRQNPGSYEIEWNAGNLPSGIYYFRIEMNNQRLTRKGLLLK